MRRRRARWRDFSVTGAGSVGESGDGGVGRRFSLGLELSEVEEEAEETDRLALRRSRMVSTEFTQQRWRALPHNDVHVVIQCGDGAQQLVDLLVSVALATEGQDCRTKAARP